MLTVHGSLLAGPAAHATVVAALVGVAGLAPAGALAGLAYGAVATALLVRGLARSGAATLDPADPVTLVGSALLGGVAVLVAQSFVGPTPALVLTALAVVALVLDGVDGRVARRTGTASALGGRFDGEVDAPHRRGAGARLSGCSRRSR